jgi:hypothetical protein
MVEKDSFAALMAERQPHVVAANYRPLRPRHGEVCERVEICDHVGYPPVQNPASAHADFVR